MQCIVDYSVIMLPYIRKAIRSLNLPFSLNEKEVLQWIIEEELELIYGIFTFGHLHNQYPYERIHNLLELSVPAGLSRVTAAYIKGPKLYSTNNVKVEITNFDLIMEYFIDHLNFTEGIKSYGTN